jgi:hypothetical protein
VHNDLHPGNFLVNTSTADVFIIDFGLAGAPAAVATSNNVRVQHDVNELLWHILYSWEFPRAIVGRVERLLSPFRAVGPLRLPKLWGLWKDRGGVEWRGRLSDRGVASDYAFFPDDERVLTRYGHNRPMYPAAVVEANGHTAQRPGTFQGLLLEDEAPQEQELEWIPDLATIRVCIITSL